MISKEEKEFIDALEDRNYVVVINGYKPNFAGYATSYFRNVVTDRLTRAELLEIIPLKRKEFAEDITCQSMYVAHYKDLEQPIGFDGI